MCSLPFSVQPFHTAWLHYVLLHLWGHWLWDLRDWIGQCFSLHYLFFWVSSVLVSLMLELFLSIWWSLALCSYWRVKHQKPDWIFCMQEELVDQGWCVEVAWHSISWKRVVFFIRRPPKSWIYLSFFLKTIFAEMLCCSIATQKCSTCGKEYALVSVPTPVDFLVFHPKLSN